MDARFHSTFALAKLSVSCLSAMLVVGCSDGSAVPDFRTQKATDGTTTETAKITLGLTDTPVDQATAVVVEFTGVTFQRTGGESFTHAFDTPRQVDVLSLQGGAREMMLTDLEIPSGAYDWVRFDINAKYDGVTDSYIAFGDTKHELELKRVPGLQLNIGFEVGAGLSKDLTIDFDLSKSISKEISDGQWGPYYRLSPTMRLVETDATGSVAGVIDPAIFAGMDCSAVDQGWAVYVYQGADVTPDDIDGTDINPIKVTQVNYGEAGYEYRTAYLPEGEYTLAATCQADMDDPEADDFNDTIQRLTFADPVTVTVTMGEETTLNF